MALAFFGKASVFICFHLFSWTSKSFTTDFTRSRSSAYELLDVRGPKLHEDLEPQVGEAWTTSLLEGLLSGLELMFSCVLGCDVR